jgi:hypothetical protein
MSIPLRADQANNIARTTDALINTSTQPRSTTNRVHEVGTSPGAPTTSTPPGKRPELVFSARVPVEMRQRSRDGAS